MENIYHSVNRIYFPMIFKKFSVFLYENSTFPIMNVYCIENKKKFTKLFLFKTHTHLGDSQRPTRNFLSTDSKEIAVGAVGNLF